MKNYLPISFESRIISQTQLKSFVFLSSYDVGEFLKRFDTERTNFKRGREVITKFVLGNPRDLAYLKKREKTGFRRGDDMRLTYTELFRSRPTSPDCKENKRFVKEV